jgi:hypothetical protein
MSALSLALLRLRGCFILPIYALIEILHQAFLPHPNPAHESGEGAIISS